MEARRNPSAQRNTDLTAARSKTAKLRTSKQSYSVEPFCLRHTTNRSPMTKVSNRMTIALRMYYLFRILPITLFPFTSSARSQQSLPPILIGRKELQSDWPRLRMFVLYRDRSRCRGCDRKGDEVTLCIHLIRPDASGPDAVLTLCVKCSDLAIEKDVKGDTIPDFLRLLWRNIYHPEMSPAAPPAIPASLRERKWLTGTSGPSSDADMGIRSCGVRVW